MPALAFALPTYLFVGTLLITIARGISAWLLLSGGHPTPAFRFRLRRR
jgi:hypothetical protein